MRNDIIRQFPKIAPAVLLEVQAAPRQPPYTILYYNILYHNISMIYYAMLYYTILWYTILYNTIQYYYTILCYAIIYYCHTPAVLLDVQATPQSSSSAPAKGQISKHIKHIYISLSLSIYGRRKLICIELVSHTPCIPVSMLALGL